MTLYRRKVMGLAFSLFVAGACGGSNDAGGTGATGAFASGSGGASGNASGGSSGASTGTDTQDAGATGWSGESASGNAGSGASAAASGRATGTSGSASTGSASGTSASAGGAAAGAGSGMSVDGGNADSAVPPTPRGDGGALVHPGGWQTQADLTRVRAQVAANQAPWSTAWSAFKNSEAGVNYTGSAAPNITDAYAIQHDGHAAYVLAIKWVASGDIAFANAAMRLIDSWTSTVKSVANEPLRNGVGSAQMANAAEILAHGFNGAAGWPVASVARAQSWFVNVIYNPHTKGGAAANWGTSAMIGNMSMAVFCDDQTMFNYSVDTYKHGFLPTVGGCSGVTQYIDATGEDAESGRDQGHSQGGIGHLLEVAQIAWNQGLDLIAYNDQDGVFPAYGATGANRLLVGLEYTAQYNLGNTVSYHPFFEYCNNVTKYPAGISATGRGNWGSQFWEMANSLFTAAGLPHTYTAQVIAQAGYAPEGTSADHPGLGTLLFRK